MRKLLFMLMLVGLALGARAANRVYTVQSPSGRITLKVTAGDRLEYAVALDGQAVIQPSALGLEFKDGAPLAGNFNVRSKGVKSFDRAWEDPLGKNSHVRDHGNELILALQERADAKRRMDLVFRVYDDAVAFRYVLPKQATLGKFVLTRDASQFAFAGDPTVWATDYKAFKSPQESEFVKQPLSKFMHQKMPSGLPFLVRLNDKAWAAVTEADLENWAGMYVGASGTPGVLQASLAPRWDKNGLVAAATPCQSPWRVVLVADRPGAFIESNTILNLNPPCAIKDPSWIKPGMMAWDNWWSADVKMDMATNEEFIQFAANMGWPYQLVDWNWYGKPNTPGVDVTKAAPQMDIPRLVQFAKERHVRLWVWTYWSDLDPKMDEAFALYEKWGLAGVKIDFMDRDDQEMVQWYEKTVRKAAAHHLMIDFHGAMKPTGMQRTWPNQVTREGIMGNEYNKWSKRVTPAHTVTLPFTRLMAGPGDFTPGGFLNKSVDTFTTGTPAKVMGTRARQLAMFVVYDSPVCCACDHPRNYRGQAGLDFLKVVPTVWDETKVLGGEPGEYILEARRKGNEWFIGAMTNEQARTLEVPLAFLGEGSHEARLWIDTPESGRQAEKIAIEKKQVKKGDTLTLKLAEAGGAVVRMVKGGQ